MKDADLPTSRSSASPKDTPKRRRRSTEELTARILQAAEQEFKRHGYIGATTASIAQKAEVTEAQLFRYFGSKAKLFQDAIFAPLDEQLRGFMAQHEPPTRDAAGVRTESAEYIEALYDLLRSNIGYIKTLMVAHAYEAQQPKGVDALTGLQKYFERGAFEVSRRHPTKMDPKLLVRVSFAAVLGCVIFEDWLFPPGLASDDEIQKAIKDFVIDGVQQNMS
jgi:AcrR family transcriptional regulator